MTWSLLEFGSREELDKTLAHDVAKALAQSLESKGRGTLAVSGGKTPTGFFGQLSREEIAWQDVTITLADDRCVPEDSEDSNARLVRDVLLQNRAATAHFEPLSSACDEPDTQRLESHFRRQGYLPLDALVLGMGNDGHTASLFPCAPTIALLMQQNCTCLFAKVQPATAPWKRVTFTPPALLEAGRIFLHVVGMEKLTVLEKAVTGSILTEMPIRAFLLDPARHITIYWAP